MIKCVLRTAWLILYMSHRHSSVCIVQGYCTYCIAKLRWVRILDKCPKVILSIEITSFNGFMPIINTNDACFCKRTLIYNRNSKLLTYYQWNPRWTTCVTENLVRNSCDFNSKLIFSRQFISFFYVYRDE